MAVRVSVDTDTWWHLRAGEYILEQREIIRHDPFSLTRFGQPWIYPGWFAQILLYGTYKLLGLGGLNLFTAIMVVLAFACVWPLLDAPPLMRASVLLLSATASGIYWSARPQIISFTLSGLFIFVLWRAKQGNQRVLWVLPPIMALWSNIHGGFAIGFLFIVCFLLGELLEAFSSWVREGIPPREIWSVHRDWLLRLGIVGLACAVAVSLNPHGPQMLVYPFKTVSIGVLRDYIQEWQSPNFHHLEVQPFLWLLLLLVITFARLWSEADWVSIILVAGFTYLSFLAARNIALFALVVAPVLSKYGYRALLPYLKRIKKGTQVPVAIARILNLVLIVLMAFAALLKIVEPLRNETIQKAVSEQVPVDAVSQILEDVPPGPMFNSYNWGGYVVWSMYPHYRSFVDGRTDLFDDETLNDYLKAWRADSGWEQVIDQWDVQLVLLEVGAPLAKSLAYRGWIISYEDDMAVVLQRPQHPQSIETQGN